MSHSRIEVKVIPGASRSEIVGWLGDALKVKVAAPPEKGKANNAVVRLLSARLGVSSAAISLVKGATASWKQFAIDGLSEQELRRLLP